ncbi:MAG: hypothetical protein EOM22_08980 [Gammaproteobacteria bacterium]|nr:hypothetical protein [Gammaproteobacteria bacterium]
MTTFVSQEFEDGDAIESALLAANTAIQPDDIGTAAAAAATDFATAAQGTKADSAVQPATLTALGDSTDITVAPVDTLDRIYTANLTGAGTLTITAAAAGKYAACLLRLTSSADGTNVLAPPAGVRWADGVAVALAPKTGQTIALFVQSVGGTIVLSAAVDQVPA